MSFHHQPVLKGKLLELRPLRSADYGDLYAVAADPLIWEQHPVKDRHEEVGFREFFREALASGGALIAVDAATQRVIGSSRFHGYSKERTPTQRVRSGSTLSGAGPSPQSARQLDLVALCLVPRIHWQASASLGPII